MTLLSGDWVDAGTVSGDATHIFIDGVAQVTSLAVRIRAVRANGAASAWVTATYSPAGQEFLLNSYVISPLFVLTQSAISTISMTAFTAEFGSNVVAYSARTFSITTPTAPTWYYVCIEDPSQTGETSAVLTSVCSTATTDVGLPGVTFCGGIQVTPTGGGVEVIQGGWPNMRAFAVASPQFWTRPVPSVPKHIGPVT